MLCFFDTNVLIYAVDPEDSAKQERALSLYAQAIHDRSFVVSTQILVEFYSVATRGKYPLLTRSQARLQVAALARQRVLTTTAKIVVDATARAEQHQMHWWDALLVEAALSIGATTLYTEDLSHGQRMGDLTITNPFLPLRA